MDIRFASIPKCASRTLKAAGLLGEVEGRFHRPIQQYPDWERYQWHIVTRDPYLWLAEWWQECRNHVYEASQIFGKPIAVLRPEGMQFQLGSFHDDIQMLKDPHTLTSLPARAFVNAWLPEDAVARYAEALIAGKDFHQFCRDTITGGHPCVQVPIDDLDRFLADHGVKPTHENPPRNDYAIC